MAASLAGILGGDRGIPGIPLDSLDSSRSRTLRDPSGAFAFAPKLLV